MESSFTDSPAEISLAFSENSHSLHEAYTLPCQRIEPSNLSEQDSLKLHVTEPHTTPHVSFLITTAPLGWTVRRNFQEFAAFRKALAAAYPNTYVPPAPPKRLKGNKSEKTGDKTLHFAEQFFEAVTTHPLLRRSPLLQSFLKAEDDWAKGPQGKIKSPDSLAEYTTLDGVAHCDPNRNVQQTTRMYEYLSSSFTLQRTIKRIAKKLEHQLIEVSESYKKLSEALAQLGRLQDSLSYTGSLKNTVNALENVVTYMSTAKLDQAKLVKEHLRNYFKYAYNEAKPMLDLIKEESHLHKTYSEADAKLNMKKEKLWVQGDVNKWELNTQEPVLDLAQLRHNRDLALTKMLSSATQKVQDQRDLVAHYNYKLTEEMRFLTDFTAARNTRRFTELCHAQAGSLRKQLEAWNVCAGELGQQAA